MNPTVISSSPADSQAAEAIREHHAQLAGALQLAVSTVLGDAERARSADTGAGAADLVRWCQRELLPHAAAEEQTLYAAARSREQSRLLVEAMSAEHDVLAGLVQELAEARTDVRSAAAARALHAIFESHLAKENELLVPMLAAAPDVALAGLLAHMHELVGQVSAADASGSPDEQAPGGHAPDEHAPDEQAPDEHAPDEHGGHACGCGHLDEPGYPVLDARSIPHAIRHATIFGALAAVGPGAGLVLVAPHDPLPLLEQVEQAEPGRFDVTYLQRGPQAWQLAFVRRA